MITKKLKIESKVRFPGAITEEEKLELYSIADVFVHTSVQEGLSLALLEAMAAETIVVATAAAGQSDTIKHGITGLLFKPADVQSLAQQTEYALSDPELQSIPKKAADYVVEDHSSEGHTRGYVMVYSEFRKKEK
jgi:glycosyltransferase involved in cell wall biosynthesis